MNASAAFLFCFWQVHFSRGRMTIRSTLPDMIQGAQQWAQENLDTNVLNALPEVDEPAVRQFFRDLQQRFQGDYVVDIAPLRQTAQTVLPLLENNEDTQPYAAWLKAQMDYLDVADEIRITIPPPTVETNQPPPVANPPPQKERELWVKKISIRPVAGRRQKNMCRS